MISLKNADGSRVLVLGNGEVDNLLTGSPIGTPDGNVLIAFSPDLDWTAAAFREAESEGGLDPQKILAILATSITKPNPEKL